MGDIWLVTCTDESDDRWWLITADDARAAVVAAVDLYQKNEDDGLPWAEWFVYARDPSKTAVEDWKVVDLFLDEPMRITLDDVEAETCS